MFGSTIKHIVVATVLLSGLAGCGTSGPDALYGLTAPSDIPVKVGASDYQVLVATPVALQALDTSNIAVTQGGGPVYSYFPKVAWTDTLPRVFQAKLVETLENTGKLRGVSQPGQGLLIDYQLQTTLRAFELQVDGGDQAYVEVAARIVDDRDGRSVGMHVFAASVPTSGDSVSDAIPALNAASDNVLAQIASWSINTVGRLSRGRAAAQRAELNQQQATGNRQLAAAAGSGAKAN
ncbi:ABC-type transport auxiliary lipoprotein family protein [Pseudovibrio axinellae]|uniref:ABC-type transport auxiliary lipoprotein family protein n=1 Tax=Pseudovibrio axinellae TaxID=989403 RepID=UPI001AD8B3F2|nr:ABC-type transport auxiliary lipoprotein family protein [Pseudovibrio axinellae]